MAAERLKERFGASPAVRDLVRRLPAPLRATVKRMADGPRPRNRRHVAAFVGEHEADVRGTVLEAGAPELTRRFGGAGVTRSEVLDVRAHNPLATIVADLCEPESLPPGEFDCILLTEATPCPEAALANAWRALAPGGVLLLAVPAGTDLAAEEPTGARLETRTYGGGLVGVRLAKAGG